MKCHCVWVRLWFKWVHGSVSVVRCLNMDQACVDVSLWQEVREQQECRQLGRPRPRRRLTFFFAFASWKQSAPKLAIDFLDITSRRRRRRGWQSKRQEMKPGWASFYKMREISEQKKFRSQTIATKSEEKSEYRSKLNCGKSLRNSVYSFNLWGTRFNGLWFYETQFTQNLVNQQIEDGMPRNCNWTAKILVEEDFVHGFTLML